MDDIVYRLTHNSSSEKREWLVKQIDTISFSENALQIGWADGRTSNLLAVWLRDHCQMPQSRNPDNGQRLMNITDFPHDVKITAVSLNDDRLTIRYSPDHESLFTARWLKQNAYDLTPAYDDRSAKQKHLWDQCSLDSDRVFYAYEAYLKNPSVKLRTLEAFADYGFVVLTDVPTLPGTVLEVIKTFGYVRQTNYGKTFDVKTVVEPNNLAFTNLGLGLHADNPYRDPVPTIQLLHCLENTVEGGESLLADGFKAAQLLQEQSPECFTMLTQSWINFRFQDERTDLHSRVPFIEVNDNGEILKVRFNNRSIAPIKLAPQKMNAFYRAYRHYAEILENEALCFEFKTQSGDLIMFDNSRIFHARRAFSDGGSRWLQGAYADTDSLYSTLAVLKRNEAQ